MIGGVGNVGAQGVGNVEALHQGQRMEQVGNFDGRTVKKSDRKENLSVQGHLKAPDIPQKPLQERSVRLASKEGGPSNLDQKS